ncbi:hypothetical protein HanIR_Chr17g0901231 [Helianthus annuus]|nr:hypothetical protein HanIR_Chr17g0901231 [Helianthus annuus]
MKVGNLLRGIIFILLRQKSEVKGTIRSGTCKDFGGDFWADIIIEGHNYWAAVGLGKLIT